MSRPATPASLPVAGPRAGGQLARETLCRLQGLSGLCVSGFQHASFRVQTTDLCFGCRLPGIVKRPRLATNRAGPVAVEVTMVERCLEQLGKLARPGGVAGAGRRQSVSSGFEVGCHVLDPLNRWGL